MGRSYAVGGKGLCADGGTAGTVGLYAGSGRSAEENYPMVRMSVKGVRPGRLAEQVPHRYSRAGSLCRANIGGSGSVEAG